MRLTDTHRRDLVNFAARTFDPVELRPDPKRGIDMMLEVEEEQAYALRILKKYGAATSYNDIKLNLSISTDGVDGTWSRRRPTDFMRVTPNDFRSVGHPFIKADFRVQLPRLVLIPDHTTLGSRYDTPKADAHTDKNLDAKPAVMARWCKAFGQIYSEVMDQMPGYLRARMDLIHAAVAIIANAKTWEEIVDFWPEAEQMKPVPVNRAMVPVPEGAVEKLCANMRTRGVTCNA